MRSPSFLERRLVGALSNWTSGRLQLTLPGGTTHVFGASDAAGDSDLTIRDRAFLRRVAWSGDFGAAESYVAGEWTTSDLPGLLTAYIRNMSTAAVAPLWRAPAALRNRLRHFLHRNTRRGSQRNIHAHYDLGNAFYELFLDQSMTYSSAIYGPECYSLEEAQRYKLDRIARKLALRESDHVLEIGCGWGSFALHAAREYGCRVTGITVSREQFEYAQRRVRDAGMAERVEILFRDYRDVQGRFDKIVSIEMLEAVGEAYWGRFARQLDRLLVPEGLALVQVICVPDQRYPEYRRDPGWVQHYIFPGGMLPSLYELLRTLRRHTQLEVHDIEEIGSHYARTLAAWRERFWKNVDRVRALGFDERFVRLWDYYLSVAQAGFATHENRDLQLVFTRPNNPRLVDPLPQSAPA